MTLKYRIIQRSNPRALTELKKYYAQAVSRGDVMLRKIYEEIADISTVCSVDTVAAIELLIQLIPKRISSGETVKLSEFGSFSIGIKSKGADAEDDFHPTMIQASRYIFGLIKN